MDGVGMPLTFPPDLDGRIEFYRRYTVAGLTFGERHPQRYVRVVYEELAASPEAVLGRLMGWLGETLETQQLEFNEVAHQEGLEDPGVGKTSAVHSGSVDRWRTDFTDDEAAVVWAATSDLWRRIDSDGEIWSPAALMARN
jgi:hypothetical protein